MAGSTVRSGNLPGPGTPIVGRASLIESVGGLVCDHSLVVLSGAGGVGKTRLAIEVGADVAHEFGDGVWMVDLSVISDPGAVPDAIAAAIGLAPQRDIPVIDAVAEALAGRRILLVVDNCEHLVAAVGSAVRTILAASDMLTILATSRESLWIAGEQRISVPPLGVEGEGSDAVQLFVARAQAVRPGFALDDAVTADAVVEICRTLDGLPLAIELAAARMASMTAPELRGLLAHRFRLLTGAGHRPERQQTLEQVVRWSYDLLDEDERGVLRAASVFLGGFTLGDLVAVIDGPDAVAVMVELDSLVHKSLVVADAIGTTTRYRLLETIRMFAEVQQSDDDTVIARKDRHALHFADAAAANWEQWNGPGWRDACDWLVAELANLRVAYRWSASRGQLVVAADIAAHAALVGVSAHAIETVAWAEALLEAATIADVPRLPRLYTAAGYAAFAGRPLAGVTHAHAARRLEQEPGRDPCLPGLTSFVEALANVYAGDLERYVELARLVADLPGPARAFGLPAYVDGLQASGRADEAVQLTTASVAAAREVGSPFWIVYALWTAGLAHGHADPTRALAAWDEGVEVVREHRVDFFEGFIARDAARLHAAKGDPEAALPGFLTALEVFVHAGNIAQLIITVASVPLVLEQLGRVTDAATLLAALDPMPASRHHVPELAVLASRLDAALGASELEKSRARGAQLDLARAAAFARERLDELQAEAERRRSSQPPGGLTRRELDVVRLVAQGYPTREIAERLFISAKTADHHIQHIYTKLGVSNRVATTRWAVEQGIVVGGIE